MTRLVRLLLPIGLAAACDLSSEPTDFTSTPGPRGMVLGVVRDTTGQGVAHAVVCAVAVFEVRGVPVILLNLDTSGPNGAYQIPMDVSVQADVRAGLTVAATPALASGLAPAMRPGLSLLLAAAPPPAETTYADLGVKTGTPYDGVFCASGP